MKIGQNKPRFLDTFLLLLVLVLMWIFVACQSKADDMTGAGTAQGSSPSTITPSSPKETVDELVTPTVTVPSSITTVMPTPSLVPTLSLAEKRTVISELYKTNDNCKLPCWWGIVPGETEWQTAQHFLDNIALAISTNQESQFDQFFTANIYLPAPHELSNREEFELYLTVRSGKVIVIEPDTPHTPVPSNRIYTVAEILNTYGRPAEIKINTYGYAHEGPNPFRIALYYPSKGILVRYADYADFVDENVVGCIQSSTGALVLWEPENRLTFAQALNGTRGLGTFGEQYYKSLEEATEMDVEIFYKTYLDRDTETCIETPTELWMDR